MNRQVRVALFVVAIICFAVLLLWGLRGLPPFGVYRGPYGDILNATAPQARQVSNVVTAVNYDYRGLDTLGEEFILFTAVSAVTMLLREQHDERELPPGIEQDQLPGRVAPEQYEVVAAAGLVFLALTVLFALYVILHGHLTPGGGFQGGSILASGWVLAYLAGSYRVYHTVSAQTIVDSIDAAGAGAYALIGLATLVAGAAFLQNILPYGQLRSLLSAGTIDVINCAVGIEVAAAFIVLFGELIKQLVAVRPEGPRADGGEQR